jgi:hypothetical protein
MEGVHQLAPVLNPTRFDRDCIYRDCSKRSLLLLQILKICTSMICPFKIEKMWKINKP